MLPCQRTECWGRAEKDGVNYSVITTERKVLETKLLYHHLATERNNHNVRITMM